MKTVILIAALLGILLLAIFGGLSLWRSLDGVAIGPHGVIAIALGAGLSILLAAALMSLVFFSAKHGYDDIDVRDD